MSLSSRFAYLISGATGRLKGPPACPSCRGSASQPVDRKYFHSILLCSECKLLYRFPRENAEEMKAFYEEGYAEPGLTTELPSDAELRRLMDTGFRGSAKDFSWHIEILRSLGLGEGSRVLDYGANWGYSTWQFRQAGFAADGFEPSRARAAFGRKLGLEISTDLSGLHPPYDAVYSCHVLEHVPDPREALHLQLSLVRDGGLVLGHTPNGSAAYRQRHSAEFHRVWGQVHPVLLSDSFISTLCSQYPYLISSDDRPEEVARWDQASQVIRDCSSAGFFFAMKKS